MDLGGRTYHAPRMPARSGSIPGSASAPAVQVASGTGPALALRWPCTGPVLALCWPCAHRPCAGHVLATCRHGPMGACVSRCASARRNRGQRDRNAFRNRGATSWKAARRGAHVHARAAAPRGDGSAMGSGGKVRRKRARGCRTAAFPPRDPRLLRKFVTLAGRPGAIIPGLGSGRYGTLRAKGLQHARTQLRKAAVLVALVAAMRLVRHLPLLHADVQASAPSRSTATTPSITTDTSSTTTKAAGPSTTTAAPCTTYRPRRPTTVVTSTTGAPTASATAAGTDATAPVTVATAAAATTAATRTARRARPPHGARARRRSRSRPHLSLPGSALSGGLGA